MVSKASDALPEPDRPVMTVSVSGGISTSIFLRLCWSAPLMEMFFCIVAFSGARRPPLGRGKHALSPVGRTGSTAVIREAEAFMWVMPGGCASCAAAERGRALLAILELNILGTYLHVNSTGWSKPRYGYPCRG